MKKTNKTDSYSHVLKYTGVFGGVQVVSILVGIIRNKFVAMILGPAGMGLVSLFNSTINLLSNSTNLGISMSAVKNNQEFKEIHMYFTARKDNPLKKMQSIMAVAAKIIRVFYGMARTGSDYDPDRLLRDIRRPEKAAA